MKILKDKTYEELLSKIAALEDFKKKQIEIDGRKTTVSPGPSSSRDLPQNTLLDVLQSSLEVVTPEFQFEVIPVIRKLSIANSSVNQAVNDLTRLANTGHKIRFNPEVSPEQIDKMREFITESSRHWHAGAAGVGGIVNKMFRQLYIGGAISTEWVPNADLTDLEELRFIKPENVRFIIEKNKRGYQPYQKLKHKPLDLTRDYRKLNTNQYRYFALNGDTDLPYGIPPFIPSLDPIATQTMMMDNIKFVVEMMGIMGFLNAKMAKPSPLPGESDAQYLARLTDLLVQFKNRLVQGRRDGVNAGYIDDHEFEFVSSTKDAKGVDQLFNANELKVAQGLNYDAIFMGLPGSTETLVTVMFTKMIAQLKNVQDIVKENLEFGYRLALTLGGFSFKSLTVEFNRSTITDELKYQQSQEILIRNLVVKYQYGIIDLEQFADELGYLAADQKEPRIDINQDNPIQDEAARKKREDGKNKSDKKGRDKKNPRGTVKRQNGKTSPLGVYKDEDHPDVRVIRFG